MCWSIWCLIFLFIIIWGFVNMFIIFAFFILQRFLYRRNIIGYKVYSIWSFLYFSRMITLIYLECLIIFISKTTCTHGPSNRYLCILNFYTFFCRLFGSLTINLIIILLNSIIFIFINILIIFYFLMSILVFIYFIFLLILNTHIFKLIWCYNRGFLFFYY
jgi:hypothetical protein